MNMASLNTESKKPLCHPERSEGSVYSPASAWILHFVQDDKFFVLDDKHIVQDDGIPSG